MYKHCIQRCCYVPTGVTYIRWSTTGSCPEGATTLYGGYAASSNSNSFSCLTSSAVYFGEAAIANETQAADVIDVQCAVCSHSSVSAMFLHAGSTSCPSGWRVEYSGFLASRRDSAADHICMDWSVADLLAIGPSSPLLPVSIGKNSNLLPMYVAGREITCAVCSGPLPVN